jgi:hypothetical protein
MILRYPNADVRVALPGTPWLSSGLIMANDNRFGQLVEWQSYGYNSLKLWIIVINRWAGCKRVWGKC